MPACNSRSRDQKRILKKRILYCFYLAALAGMLTACSPESAARPDTATQQQGPMRVGDHSSVV